MGTSLVHLHTRSLSFSPTQKMLCLGVRVSPGPELHLVATLGCLGTPVPQAGPTDSLGQVAAGWTSLFPAFLCNQVMQGQLACLHKGRRARAQLGRGRLLKGPMSLHEPTEMLLINPGKFCLIDAIVVIIIIIVVDVVYWHTILFQWQWVVDQGTKPWLGPLCF